MEIDREMLMEKLKSIKEPLAMPTVQTMDMGLEHFVFSSEGANTLLGVYGAWPCFGSFKISFENLHRLNQYIENDCFDKDLFMDMQLDFIWSEILDMFDYHELSVDEQVNYQKKFVKSIFEAKLNPNEDFYIYFHKYDSDLPLLFKSKEDLINEFMSYQDLIPWEDHDMDWLSPWSQTIDEIGEFEIISPFE